MTNKILKAKMQELLAAGRLEEAINYMFDAYQAEHPEARNIPVYRDKVRYKLKTEFSKESPETADQSKLLLFAFMGIIGDTEGETAFNIILLLLHILKKGQHQSLSQFIELLKLEKASNNLNGKN